MGRSDVMMGDMKTSLLEVVDAVEEFSGVELTSPNQLKEDMRPVDILIAEKKRLLSSLKQELEASMRASTESHSQKRTDATTLIPLTPAPPIALSPIVLSPMPPQRPLIAHNIPSTGLISATSTHGVSGDYRDSSPSASSGTVATRSTAHQPSAEILERRIQQLESEILDLQSNLGSAATTLAQGGGGKRVPTPPIAANNAAQITGRQPHRSSIVMLAASGSKQDDKKKPHGLASKVDVWVMEEFIEEFKTFSKSAQKQSQQSAAEIKQLQALVRNCVTTDLLTSKVDRTEVFSLLDAIIVAHKNDLSSANNSDGFLSSKGLIGLDEQGRPVQGNVCITCERPLNGLVRTLGEVISHQSFNPGHTRSVVTMPTQRTSRIAKQTLHELESIENERKNTKSESADRVVVSTTAPSDRYSDGKARSNVYTLPLELFKAEVDKVKTAREASKSTSRKNERVVASFAATQPFASGTEREYSDHPGTVASLQSHRDPDASPQVPSKSSTVVISPRTNDQNQNRGVKYSKATMDPQERASLRNAKLGTSFPLLDP